MKKLIAGTGVVTGLLLILIPRYILPTCEFLGYPHMHCSDTARAEMILGELFLAASALAFSTKRPWPLIANAGAQCTLVVLAWSMPDVYGYCVSPKMPCHYGTVPAIRFTAVLAGIVLVSAMVLLSKEMRRMKEAS